MYSAVRFPSKYKSPNPTPNGHESAHIENSSPRSMHTLRVQVLGKKQSARFMPTAAEGSFISFRELFSGRFVCYSTEALIQKAASLKQDHN